MINNEIPQRLRLIATGIHMAGAIPSIIVSLLPRNILIMSGDMLMIYMILASIFQPITVLFAWRVTKHIHPFIDISGRDALNCALNTLVGTIVSMLFCIFVFSVTCGVGNQDPTLFIISLLIPSFVMVTYFMNSVITGIFTLRGYRFKSRLIYPFVKSE
jgi:uncharacterized Tic20 family protein